MARSLAAFVAAGEVPDSWWLPAQANDAPPATVKGRSSGSAPLPGVARAAAWLRAGRSGGLLRLALLTQGGAELIAGPQLACRCRR